MLGRALSATSVGSEVFLVDNMDNMVTAPMFPCHSQRLRLHDRSLLNWEGRLTDNSFCNEVD